MRQQGPPHLREQPLQQAAHCWGRRMGLGCRVRTWSVPTRASVDQALGRGWGRMARATGGKPHSYTSNPQGRASPLLVLQEPGDRPRSPGSVARLLQPPPHGSPGRAALLEPPRWALGDLAEPLGHGGPEASRGAAHDGREAPGGGHRGLLRRPPHLPTGHGQGPPAGRCPLAKGHCSQRGGVESATRAPGPSACWSSRRALSSPVAPRPTAPSPSPKTKGA